MTDSRITNTKINILANILTALNFFIPFNGLMLALENYLKEDRMPLTYIMLLGLVAGIIMAVMLFLLKGRNIKIKIAGTAILLFVVIGIILWCSNNRHSPLQQRKSYFFKSH